MPVATESVITINPNTVISVPPFADYSIGFALQIAATEKAVVAAKNAPVIISAVIIFAPCQKRFIAHAAATENPAAARTEYKIIIASILSAPFYTK